MPPRFFRVIGYFEWAALGPLSLALDEEHCMTTGRTIRIYLADGSVSGIRHAEIVNWTGQAISSPRSHVKELKDWNESLKPGIYFLFGVDDKSTDEAVYIGEPENVFERLSSA